jgi:hypothetical protein
MRDAIKSLLIGIAAVGAGAAGLFAQGAPGQVPGTPAQNAPIVRTASITGQVIDGDTGEAIGGAVVRIQMRTMAAASPGRAGGRGPQALSAAEMAAQSGVDFVMADGDGRFVFHDLPAGPAQLVATLGGYVERPGATPRPVQLTTGQHLSDVKLRLVKTASISGAIVDEAGEPLVGVAVRGIRRDTQAGAAKYTQVGNARTDDRGMYRLDGLVPAQYFVVLPQTQTTVPIANAEKSAEMMNGMLGANSPIMEALTGGMQSMFGPSGVRVGGQMWQSSSGGGPGGSAAPPPPVNGRVAAYQTTYFPGVTQLSQATPVSLRSGESRTAVDWQVRPTGVARVGGVLTGPEGPAGSVALRLVVAQGIPEDDTAPVAIATTAADGSFMFMGVPSGSYIAKAQQQARGGPAGLPAEMLASLPPEAMAMLQGRMGGSGDASFLRAPVGVDDKDVLGLAFVLRPGAKVSGRVAFEGAAAQPTTQQLTAAQISLVPTGVGPGASGPVTKLASDGTFKTGAYAPGNWTISVTGIPGGWLMKSAMVNGRDATMNGFELGDTDIADVVITYTDRVASITGTVKPDGTASLPNTTVIMITADYRAWLAGGGGGSRAQVTSIVQPNGNYALGRLLPGDYLLAAVPDEALITEHDAAFYDALARVATRVTVAEGEKKTLELRLLRSIR